jgi:predicted RNA-binding protein YlqC (UPF0109 family)
MADMEKAAELVNFMAKSIVTEPDAVQVSEGKGATTLELQTAPGDRGRVIGRQGRVAKAMRAVLAASGVGGEEYRLEIVD